MQGPAGIGLKATMAIGLCAVAVMTAAGSPAPRAAAPNAAPPALVASWSAPEMKSMLVDMGLSVTRQTRLDNGDPLLAVRAADGAGFVVQGAACSGVGTDARCLGASLTAFVSYDSPAKTQAALERLTYPVVTVTAEDDRTVTINRYIVFDQGIHRRNFEANVRLFLAVLGEARSLQ
jgi:hypothetical protein